MKSVVRIFSAANYGLLQNNIDAYLKNNSNWEVVSISQALIPNGVSIACVLKFVGKMDKDFVLPEISEASVE